MNFKQFQLMSLNKELNKLWKVWVSFIWCIWKHRNMVWFKQGKTDAKEFLLCHNWTTEPGWRTKSLKHISLILIGTNILYSVSKLQTIQFLNQKIWYKIIHYIYFWGSCHSVFFRLSNPCMYVIRYAHVNLYQTSSIDFHSYFRLSSISNNNIWVVCL